MNQLSFVQTRARRNDSSTSKDAAKSAVSGKAAEQRLCIYLAVKTSITGLTAREVAAVTGLDYIAVQRRLAECGMTKTDQRRDGCAVWVAV